MRSVQTRLAVALVAVVNQCLAFQAICHSKARSYAYAPPRQPPLQAAFMDDLTSAYSYGMANYYLATQSVMGGVLCGVGDAMAQVKERISCKEKQTLDFRQMNGNSIDLERLFRFALKGLGGGVIWSQWYGVADEWSLTLSNDLLNHFDNNLGDGIHRVVQTLMAILLEQFVACPLVYSLWDIPFPMIMNGSSAKTIPTQVQQKIVPLLVENAKVWSFVNILIYNIPVEYRLLTMGMADVFWQSVIASVTADAVANAESQDELPAEVAIVQTNAPDQHRVVARLTE